MRTCPALVGAVLIRPVERTAACMASNAPEEGKYQDWEKLRYYENLVKGREVRLITRLGKVNKRGYTHFIPPYYGYFTPDVSLCGRDLSILWEIHGVGLAQDAIECDSCKYSSQTNHFVGFTLGGSPPYFCSSKDYAWRMMHAVPSVIYQTDLYNRKGSLLNNEGISQIYKLKEKENFRFKIFGLDSAESPPPRETQHTEDFFFIG